MASSITRKQRHGKKTGRFVAVRGKNGRYLPTAHLRSRKDSRKNTRKGSRKNTRKNTRKSSRKGSRKNNRRH